MQKYVKRRKIVQNQKLRKKKKFWRKTDAKDEVKSAEQIAKDRKTKEKNREKQKPLKERLQGRQTSHQWVLQRCRWAKNNSWCTVTNREFPQRKSLPNKFFAENSPYATSILYIITFQEKLLYNSTQTRYHRIFLRQNCSRNMPEMVSFS